MSRDPTPRVFYLYDQTGTHEDPLTPETIAAAIRAGTLAPDTLLAPEIWFESKGKSGWMRAGEIPEVKLLLERDRRGTDLEMVEGAFKTTPLGVAYDESVLVIGPTKKS